MKMHLKGTYGTVLLYSLLFLLLWLYRQCLLDIVQFSVLLINSKCVWMWFEWETLWLTSRFKSIITFFFRHNSWIGYRNLLMSTSMIYYAFVFHKHANQFAIVLNFSMSATREKIMRDKIRRLQLFIDLPINWIEF